jgi:uncharacterized repeat protein (TIGR02543 family)
MHRLRKMILGVVAGTALSQAGFDPCKFNFGESWEGPGASYSAQSDYITIWIGDGGGKSTYNTYWEGDMLKQCKSGTLKGKTPVLYSYIIAFLAKNTGGLRDCDVAGQGSSSSLCVSGANFIRNNRSKIIDKYGEFAAGAARDFGTSAPIIWLLEPDFLQYHEATSYWGTQANPLSLTEAGSLLTDIIAKIKTSLPNAQISFDISPWLGGTNWQTAHKEWLNAMPKSSFNYRNTSGGRTQGDQARIRSDANNLATWAGISSLSGVQIIADDGYGVGGASNNEWYEWMSASALNARIADGVVALSIQKPASDFTSRIAAIRGSLNKPNCSGGGWTPTATKFKLTTSGPNGTLTLSPAGGTYDSGTTVTVTATPNAGYTFTNWTSGCTGTGACKIVMNDNDLVSAVFTAFPTVTVTKMGTGTGSVTSTPNGINCGSTCTYSYAPGTSVTLTATPDAGNSFVGWSGACTGTSTCTVSLSAPKAATATFKVGASSGPSKFTFATTATNGSIALSPAGGTYDSNTTVTATATPATGYVFSGWSGACTGTGACSVKMNSNKTLTASFKVSSGIAGHLEKGQRLSMGQGFLTFDPSNMGYSHLELISTQGKSTVLWQGQGNMISQVALQGLPTGLYFARLRGASESFQQMIQIVR